MGSFRAGSREVQVTEPKAVLGVLGILRLRNVIAGMSRAYVSWQIRNWPYRFAGGSPGFHVAVVCRGNPDASCRVFRVRLRFTAMDVVRGYEFDGGLSRICNVKRFKNPLVSGYP